MTTETELYEECIKKWGVYPQLIQFYGEVGELMAAVCDFDRKRVSKQKIVDEIADVLIMINQIKVLTKVTDSEIQIMKEYKLKRLEERLKQ
jgi:NTP pyrophosphatase (non-canonical NTP hydrolase)